ncbi:MAG: helix-turn-helix domain-containing protein [Oscillospiraceae bacterium]
MEVGAERRNALDKQIEARRGEIIDAAIREFIKNGIENSKISDIAKRARVGTVTVYRYFENKPRLVVECAVKLWHSEMRKLTPLFNPENSNEMSGFEKVRQILGTIGSLYETRPDMLRLLEQFDNYTVKEQISKELLQKYEAGIINTRVMMLEALRTGQEDGSIRPEIDALQFYTTAIHSTLPLIQKLLLRGDVIRSDREIDAKTQIALLINMELAYIRA